MRLKFFKFFKEIAIFLNYNFEITWESAGAVEYTDCTSAEG